MDRTNGACRKDWVRPDELNRLLRSPELDRDAQARQLNSRRSLLGSGTHGPWHEWVHDQIPTVLRVKQQPRAERDDSDVVTVAPSRRRLEAEVLVLGEHVVTGLFALFAERLKIPHPQRRRRQRLRRRRCGSSIITPELVHLVRAPPLQGHDCGSVVSATPLALRDGIEECRGRERLGRRCARIDATRPEPGAAHPLCSTCPTCELELHGSRSWRRSGSGISHLPARLGRRAEASIRFLTSTHRGSTSPLVDGDVDLVHFVEPV